MFIDTAKIKVYGGKGGAGCVSFHHTSRNPRGGPDGGNGGRGGDVIIRADRQLATLCDYFYQPISRADNGTHGGSNRKYGAAGASKTLRVPVGTIVRDRDTGETLADLDAPGQELVVAKGGRGGFGNLHYKSSTNRAPRKSEPGGEGQYRSIELELKLLADIGLVGFPNAGKSTLISGITHAHSRIASYPFTTRQPILGLLEFPDFTSAVIADIPGIVDGAHRNVGLGHQFLRHVERCSILLLLIDMAGVDNRDPRHDYEVLLRELSRHDEKLGNRHRLVVANKMDLPAAAANLDAFKGTHGNVPIMPISALEGAGLDELTGKLHTALNTNNTKQPTQHMENSSE